MRKSSEKQSPSDDDLKKLVLKILNGKCQDGLSTEEIWSEVQKTYEDISVEKVSSALKALSEGGEVEQKDGKWFPKK